MKHKLLITMAAIVIALTGSMTVCAQPAAMPDGTVFDAEFYAQTYPDVVAVFGTDANALYQHYVTYGIAEGRLATNPAAQLPAAQAAPAEEPAALEVSPVPYDEGAVWQLTNAQRAAANLPALAWDDSLWASASQRSLEISVLFSHTRPDGTSCFTAISPDLHLRTMGENIAMGQRSAEEVVVGWMNSEGHRENILRPTFTRIGVGCYRDAAGRAHWVQLFGG